MGEARWRVAVVGVSHWRAPIYLAALRAGDEQIVGVSDPAEAVAGWLPPLLRLGAPLLLGR